MKKNNVYMKDMSAYNFAYLDIATKIIVLSEKYKAEEGKFYDLAEH